MSRRNINKYRSDFIKMNHIKTRSYFTKWQGVGLFLHSLILVTGSKTVLEIGTGEGYTAISMALSLPDGGMVYTVDINKKRRNKILPDIFQFKLENKITLITDNSRTMEWDTPIDLLFIDGDHSYDTTLSDFERFSPYVKSDGLILFHDHTDHPDVKKVIDDVVKKEWNCIIIDWDCGISMCQRR